MTFCNKCGKKLEEGRKFCNKCGASVIQDKKLKISENKIKTCNKCGKEVLPEAIFCPKCGTSVKELKKKEETVIKEPSMAKLLEYCKKQLKKGYTKEQLMEQALKAGWTKTKIDEVLKTLPTQKEEESEEVIEETVKEAISKKEEPSLKKVEEEEIEVVTRHAVQGVSKKIFYPVLVILIIGLIAVSWNLNNYMNELHAMENLYQQQKSETAKYQGMYDQEATGKQQEIQKRQEAEAEASRLGSQLYSEQQRASEIQSELYSTQTELEQAQQQVSAVKAEVSDVVSTLNSLETWVSESARLPYDKLANIHGSCRTYRSNCVIDAEAMAEDMFACLNFDWVDDIITSNFGTGERIFDIDTFWQSKEGDCDDFALFFASWLRAEYSSAQMSCAESSIYIKLSDSMQIKCPCDIYSVCGAYGNSGHCETGVAQSYYKPSDGYTFFSNLYIIEPQGGGYGGSSLQEFKNVWEFFSINDYALVNNYIVTKSIQSVKNKLSQINI